MSLESARKLGATASLINVLLPVVAIIGAVAFVLSVFLTTASEIATGTAAPTFLGISLGFFVFLVIIIAFALAGFIMFMVAMYRLSNYYHEPGIFKNVLYAFILSIILYVIVFAFEFAFIFSSLANISVGSSPATFVPAFPIFIIVVFLAAIAFGITVGWLYMQAFNKLKEKSGVDNFGTAGILYLVGTIVPLVGWIAWIFAYLGFRKLQPSSPTQTVSYQTQPTFSGAAQTKRCLRCGKENSADAYFCKNCGNPL